MHRKNVQAFSLIEISIVLVILGLLVGGVLGGRSLIHNAKLMKVVSNYQEYKLAVNTFEVKYDSWPGDMTDATQYWGAADGGDGYGLDCYNVDSTGEKSTCNGNGNGRLFYRDNVTNESGPEWYRAWQHLANAGLVQGQFSGKADASPRGATPGVNIPKSPMGGGYTLMSYSAIPSDGNWWTGEYDGLQLGAPYSTGETQGALLTAPEAWQIDKKIDDGMPGTGFIRSRRWQTWCHSGSDASTAVYQLQQEERIACPLIMSFTPPGS